MYLLYPYIALDDELQCVDMSNAEEIEPVTTGAQ